MRRGAIRGLRGLGLGATIALASSLTACGGGMTAINVFSTDWTDDGGQSIEALQTKLAGVRAPRGADVAVGVAGNGDKLIGLPLGDPGAKWTFAHPLDARPMVTGNVVVGSGGGELFALDATTGKRLWARPTGGLKVHGAGDDGSVTVVSLASGTGIGSRLLAVLHDGSVARQIETDKTLGTPAVLGGFAFVPWGGVYVSAIDLANGNEAGRVVVREKTSRAWTESGDLYFGEIGIFRFDGHIKDAPKSRATHVSIPVRELPGSPKLMEPGTEISGPAAGAPDRIRIYARPSAGDGPLAIDAGRYYATYFRFVMGFDATKGALTWVHSHDSDVIGGAAAPGAVVLCDEQGHVTTLDAKTGGKANDADLGEPIKGCVVQVDQYETPGEPAAVPPLAEQLSAALLNRESELATAKRLLLRELAGQSDEIATKTLIDLASDPRTSPLLLPDARQALASRHNGASYMLAALAVHYDFMKDVLRPPPVGPIAQALAAMNESRGASLLAAHLLDPADTDDDVRHAAEALVKLAGPNEAPALTQFFGTYRASAPSDDVEAAVVSVGQALAKVGGKDGAERVQTAMNDASTPETVRERLKATVAVAPPAPADDAAKPAKGAEKPKADKQKARAKTEKP
jgi:outer membrane protein assembly factor BamB